MYKNYARLSLVATIIILLSGCVSGSSTTEKPKYTNKQLIESSGNNQELIKLYKQELLSSDTPETRVKLVHSYIKTKDFESAIFYIQPLIGSDKPNAEAYFLYGKAKFGLNELSQAQIALQKAIQLDPNHGDALNLYGVISAYNGDYVQARKYFVQARQRMIDDVTVKNNLAMVDLIEGKYESAVDKLTPLLAQGNSSPKVRSNLAFAYAKLGQYQQFAQLLADVKITAADMKQIYQQLANVELIAFEGPPDFLAADSNQL
jgi:tight adherence protein D